MTGYEQFASDVMIDLTRRFAKAFGDGDLARREKLMHALNVLGEEYPEARAELDRLYGQKAKERTEDEQ